MKNLVTIEARVYAPTNYSSEMKVELQIKEEIRNPKFPNQPSSTYAIFTPSSDKKHMRKSTLDYLLLAQGKAVTFGDRDKVVNITLDNIPADFIKGYRKDGARYYGIKVNLSAKPNETHYKVFFTDDMSIQMIEDFCAAHKFVETVKTDEDLNNEADDEEDEEKDE